MKKFCVFKKSLYVLMGSVLLIAMALRCSGDHPEAENYSIASSDYGIMAEKSLDLMSSFQLETWGTMLSDSVIYHFPDDTRSKLVGKPAVLNWWKTYRNTSGIESMTIENASYLPVTVNKSSGLRELPGVKVIAYFSNRIIYKDHERALKMNFVIHFDKNKMIDRYYTYYDNPDTLSVNHHL